LSENLEIPRDQAQEYIDAYLARFPHVQDFIERTIQQATEDGYVTSLLGPAASRAGDPRPEPPDARLRRADRRSTSLCRARTPDIIKVAMVRSRAGSDEGRAARPRPPGARRAAARGARTSSSPGIRDLVREEMCGAYPLDPPLAVDVGVGDDWAEAKS
jgi:DNA polymerase-1